MNYAVQILENEINMIQRCLTEWESKELNEALNKIK